MSHLGRFESALKENFQRREECYKVQKHKKLKTSQQLMSYETQRCDLERRGHFRHQRSAHGRYD